MAEPQRPTPLPNEKYYEAQNGQAQPRRWGSVLLIIGVVWLVFELTRQSFFGGLFLGNIEEREKEAPQVFVGATALNVQTTAEGVHLFRNDGAISVEVERRGFGWNSNAARDALRGVVVRVTEEGGQINVQIERPAGNLFFGRSPQVDLRIGVPPGAAIIVRTTSGTICAEGVTGTGSLTSVSGDICADESEGSIGFYSTSGDIDVTEHRGSPSLRTVSGNIEVSGAALNGLAIESISGDLIIGEMAGELRAKTISGAIEVAEGRDLLLDLESTSGDIEVSASLAAGQEQRVRSVSGSVQFYLTNPAGLRLEATTLSGDLESALDLEQAVRERRRLAGSLGTGETSLLISTTSGDVSVEEE